MLLAPSEGQLVLVHVFLLRGLSEPSKSRDDPRPTEQGSRKSMPSSLIVAEYQHDTSASKLWPC